MTKGTKCWRDKVRSGAFQISVSMCAAWKPLGGLFNGSAWFSTKKMGGCRGGRDYYLIVLVSV